jgi:diguanylate cyclase (GGDEF)-like protein
MSAAVSKVNELPSRSTTLEPYGQLIRMLMPRAQSIAIYDRMGVPAWMSDGRDVPELRRLLQEALSAESRAGERSTGRMQPMDGEHAVYVFLLRDGAGTMVGAAGVVCREAPKGREARPFTLVHGLLRPVLDCLERELGSQHDIGALQRDLVVRDGDLDLLLGDTQDEATGSAEDFAQLVQSCVAHLGCSVGALVIPDRNIAVCRTGEGTPPRAGADILTQTHRPLLAWTLQQQKSLVSNEANRAGVLARVPYKVLCCPVMQGAQRVLGMLALYKPPGAPDFDLRQVRIVELLARRAAHILLNAYDPATGLLTRPSFEKRAQAALRTDAPVSENCVIYVDIDRLHVLNENLGLHVGDEVIVRVAEVIRRALAPRMLASRISGDRFAVLMVEAPLDRGQEFAEMLCDQLGALDFIAGGKAVEVSASFGVARVGDGKQPLPHALAAAEIACKAAKDRGRNRVELYEDSDQSIVRRYTDVTLVGKLRQALAQDSFRLEAQAIVPLNGAVPGAKYELLLRMTDEQQQTITPEKFLSAAERYQLAPAVDRWVVGHVLKLLTPLARPLADKGAKFAVNISGQSLGDESFFAFIDTRLREARIPPQILAFELTETAAVANIVRAEALIRRLRDLGFEVALDDFGRGLSSLGYLKTLPVTSLKIDSSLVRDIAGDNRSQAMLSAIVQLARAIGLKTVAEGVETEETRQITARLGVDFAQGFGIGRPEALEGVIERLVAAKL